MQMAKAHLWALRPGKLYFNASQHSPGGVWQELGNSLVLTKQIRVQIFVIPLAAGPQISHFRSLRLHFLIWKMGE